MQMPSQIADWATAIGVLIAILAYWFERRRSSRQHAIDRYLQLNSQYREWLTLYIENPELHEVLPHAPRASHLPPQRRMAVALLELKLCELESAFYLYRRHRTPLDKSQWIGWSEHIQDWAKFEGLQEEWNKGIGALYDKEFQEYMEDLMPRTLTKADSRRPDPLGVRPGSREGAEDVSPQQISNE